MRAFVENEETNEQQFWRRDFCSSLGLQDRKTKIFLFR